MRFKSIYDVIDCSYEVILLHQDNEEEEYIPNYLEEFFFNYNVARIIVDNKDKYNPKIIIYLLD